MITVCYILGSIIKFGLLRPATVSGNVYLAVYRVEVKLSTTRYYAIIDNKGDFSYNNIPLSRILYGSLDSKSLVPLRCKQVKKEVVMTTTLQNALTLDDMIDELMTQGTIAGRDSLDGVLKAQVGLMLFAQEEKIHPDVRKRQLSGIALSRDITFARLQQQMHDQLVWRLKCQIEVRLGDGAVGGKMPALVDEIVAYQA